MITKRQFLLSGASLVALAALGVGFGGFAEAENTGEVFEVTKTEEEWRALLTPEQYSVLREEGTERPGTSALLEGASQGHLRLRRLRPAALLLRHEVRERHRLAELLGGDRRQRRPSRRTRPSSWPAPRSIAAAAAGISAMSSTTARRRPASATASMAWRWSSIPRRASRRASPAAQQRSRSRRSPQQHDGHRHRRSRRCRR